MVGAPHKVFVPVIPPWMEKRHALSRDRIERVRLVGFGAVTSLAGQREIIFGAGSAQAFRRDVLDGMELRRAIFRRDAILAVAVGASPDQALQLGGKALVSHAERAGVRVA